MITEWLISVGTGIAGFFADFFGTFQVPDWVTDSAPTVYGFLDSASGFGVWVPWEVIGAVTASLVSLYGITFAARLIQKIWGLIPVVGGSG